MRYNIITVTTSNFDDIINDDDLFEKSSHVKFEGLCCVCGKPFSKFAKNVKNRNNISRCMVCSVKHTKLLKYGNENYANIDKAKETNLQKYGTTCAMNTKENIEKRKNKFIEIYGSLENFNKHSLEKRNKTIIENYGSLENFNKLKLEKIKKTNFEKYGVEYSTQSEIMKEKTRETWKKNYGENVENISQVEEIKEKKRQTNLAKYGKEEYLRTDDCKEKTKQTSISKYGVDNPNSSDIVKLHKKESTLKKYGVNNVNQLDWVRDKIRNTCVEKYGKLWNQYKFEYDNNKFDSSWELIYYIYLKENNVDFIFHPKVDISYKINEKIHKYEPDFLINSQLIEIKGDHFFNEKGELINPYNKELMLEKQNCMIENNVKILKKDDLSDAFEYFESKHYNLNGYVYKKGDSNDNN